MINMNLFYYLYFSIMIFAAMGGYDYYPWYPSQYGPSYSMNHMCDSRPCAYQCHRANRDYYCSCPSGYELKNDKHGCQKKEVQCGSTISSLKRLGSVKATCENTRVGDKCVAICNAENIDEERSYVCDVDGQWIPETTPLTCIESAETQIFSNEDINNYCKQNGCWWTEYWSCPWESEYGIDGPAIVNPSDIGYYACCVSRQNYDQQCGTLADSQCVIEQNVDYYDKDLKEFRDVESSEACAKLCAQEADCLSWVYIKNPDHEWVKSCHLKASVMPDRRDDDCCDSGLPCDSETEDDVLFSDDDIYNYCQEEDCEWTEDWSCPWDREDGKQGRAGEDVADLGYYSCCVSRQSAYQQCGHSRLARQVEDIIEENVAGLGEWGAICHCPNGGSYPVADIGDSGCSAFACIGGTVSSDCFQEQGEWSYKQVTCAPEHGS